MRVVIPSTSVDCVAGRALTAEGVKHEVRVVLGPLGYGDLLADAWADGAGFVLVEDDIAPWPGAIAALAGCANPWCGFDYSIGFGRFGLGTLGCVKFGRDLTRRHPSLPDGWAGVPWHALDASVVAAVRAATGRQRFHEHEPAVAHVQHYRQDTR